MIKMKNNESMKCRNKNENNSRRGAAALGFTLLWVYISVGVTLFMLYLVFDLLMPTVAALDNAMYQTVTQMQAAGTINESWVSTYTSRGVWIMHDAFYWLFFGYVGGLILIVFLYGASRRQTTPFG